MSVNLCEEGVIVECLLVNARTHQVNLRSLSEVSSSSSPNGTGSSGLSERLGFLVAASDSSSKNSNWGLNVTRQGGVENPRNGDEAPPGAG